MNSTVVINLSKISDYDGECAETFNSLTIDIKENWQLRLNFTLVKDQFELSTLGLDYFVDVAGFPNAAPSELGQRSAELANLTEFATNTGNSYKCSSHSSIMLNKNVIVDLSEFQTQPFMKKDRKQEGFDTAVDCPADLDSTSKLVPIIVGSALAVLVILVLIAYVIGRRKHRPGYQQV